MVNPFSSIFTQNKRLSLEDKALLVAASKGKLTTDALFDTETVNIEAIKNILQNYGWFWVTIKTTGGSLKEVVVNDLDALSQNRISYLDCNTGEIHVEELQDFHQKVKGAFPDPEALQTAVIRLNRKAGEGSNPREYFIPSEIENPNGSYASREFVYYGYKMRNGNKVEVSEGELVHTPGSSRLRDLRAQRNLSAGTGDHAGHRIAISLGGAPGIENMGRQNAYQNAWGTFIDLENEWRKDMRNGARILVRVSDIYRPGAVRPHFRYAEYVVFYPNGDRIPLGVHYINNHPWPDGVRPPRRQVPPKLLPFVRKNPLNRQTTGIGMPVSPKAIKLQGFLEIVNLGMNLAKGISTVIALSEERDIQRKMISIRRINWWLRCNVVPEIRLIKDGELLSNMTQDEAYDTIMNPDLEDNWDDVVITDIGSEDFRYLISVFGKELNFASWILLCGHPDALPIDRDEDDEIEKYKQVKHPIFRLSFFWFYMRYDVQRGAYLPYPISPDISVLFQELFNELYIDQQKVFDTIPKSEIFTVKDDVYVFRENSWSIKIDFSKKVPKFTKTPYFNELEFDHLQQTPMNREFGDTPHRVVYAADMDTIFYLSFSHWSLYEDALPSDSYYQFINPGYAFVAEEKLYPLYPFDYLNNLFGK